MIEWLNVVSVIALFIASVILIRRVILKTSVSTWLLALALLFLMGAALTNVLEHMNIAPQWDELEDMLDILFLPTMILSLHILILEKELSQRVISEKKFEAIFENSYTFIGLLDAQGRVVDGNEKALKFAEVTKEDVELVPFENTPWWSHSPEEQAKIRAAIEKVASGKFVHMEALHVNTGKQKTYIDFSLTPVFNEKKEVIYMIPEGRDITQVKMIQQELEKHKGKLERLVTEKTQELNMALNLSTQLNKKLTKSNQELEKRNQELKNQSEYLELTLARLQSAQEQLVESEKMASLGILTAGVAHEINNPLNFILGGVTSIDKITSEQYDRDNSEIREMIELIYAGINRIARIVKSLNSYARNDNYEVSQCNINQILDDCLIILENKYRYRITVGKKYHEKPIFSANEGRIHQVFLNLIDNAIQSIEDIGEITLRTNVDKGQVVVSIIDNGIGISETNLKHIFDPFFTTKGPDRGTGLGLSISHRIITEYKGTVHINSTEGKGTQVEVRFPQIL